MSDQIIPILMPKWGLSMRVGTLAAWHVEEGTDISPSDEIMDVETDKIANVVEAADGGSYGDVLDGQVKSIRFGHCLVLWHHLRYLMPMLMPMSPHLKCPKLKRTKTQGRLMNSLN